jgi:murein DD-endopeptidase MepM/ murein hydrolase activator NlpD
LDNKSKPIVEVTAKVPEQPSQEQGAFHVVGAGETLRHVCDVYGLDFEKVARLNKIMPPHTLKEGETVFLPAYALLPDKNDAWNHTAGSRGKSSPKIALAKREVTCPADTLRGYRDPAVPLLKFPVPKGVLTSPFGYRWGRFHRGLDIAAPIGRSVLACANGRVVFTGSRKRFRRYGNTVLIDHGRGAYTTYAHLNEIVVKKGQTVRRGQKIATIGDTGRSTGPHLHVEVRVGNKMYNPLAYFSPAELTGTKVAKRFTDSPMGPVRAHWRVPELLTAGR